MNRNLLIVAALFGLVSFTTVNAQSKDTPMGADRHMAKGVPCAACHGKNNEIATPSIDQCSTCHNPDQVAAKTTQAQPRNPHVSPHYGNKLDCALCHLQHSKPENFCAQCHDFEFKVR